MRALREAKGVVTRVSDEAILDAMRLAGAHGVFAEPAAAAAVAGVVSALGDGTIGRDDRVLAMITGSGLKDIHSAIRAGGQPHRIPPETRRGRRGTGRPQVVCKSRANDDRLAMLENVDAD